MLQHCLCALKASRSWRIVIGLLLVALSGLSTLHAGTPTKASHDSALVRILKHAPSTQPADKTHGALVYWDEAWTKPRPVRMHFLQVDLSNPAYELVTVLGDDPDANGPDEATLTPPVELAEKYGLITAINANAFRHSDTLSPAEKKKGWRAGNPVDVFGLVVTDGKERSASDPRRIPLWIDQHSKAHIGFPRDTDHPQQAIANWEGPLLQNGRVVVQGRDVPLPRTVVGIDRRGHTLLMLMAEGRQKGRTEGLTLREAAKIMLDHGCHDAINVDGGGSSIMLANVAGHLKVMNHAPGNYLRPIPVMFGVRLRQPIAQPAAGH